MHLIDATPLECQDRSSINPLVGNFGDVFSSHSAMTPPPASGLRKGRLAAKQILQGRLFRPCEFDARQLDNFKLSDFLQFRKRYTVQKLQLRAGILQTAQSTLNTLLHARQCQSKGQTTLRDQSALARCLQGNRTIPKTPAR